MVTKLQDLKKSILQTIIYSDIFDYPLTRNEIWRFLINNPSEMELSNLPHSIVKKDGFYYLRNRRDIVSKRLKREKESNKKLHLAKKIISELLIIPTVELIGISGALAMKNSDADDDIDLFVIAKKNTLWTTRLFLILFLEALGRRRRREVKDIKNKICLNFLIDESAMLLPKEMQNLYGAHEVVQLVPIFDRGNTYQKFINANSWVRKFLPNAIVIKKLRNKPAGRQGQLLNYFLPIIEWFTKSFQLWYIQKHRTKEIIGDHFLAFHPLDYKDKILSAYKEQLDRLTRGY